MNMPVSYNDGILLVSLVYSAVELQLEWDSFRRCHRPIHQWLFVSFALVIVFRVTHILGTRAAEADSGDFLLDLRQKHAAPRVLSFFTWLIALPFFTFWTAVGTHWIWQTARATPDCVPTKTHLWFSVFWLALCYIWIGVHIALGAVAVCLERRVRAAEGSLRAVEDADVISRWGQVSELADYRALAGRAPGAGLTPQELSDLPAFEAPDDAAEQLEAGEECECSICLFQLRSGDNVRRLPACGHAFHRSCIDLWLLRRADCPLCKRNVRCSVPAASARGGSGWVL